MERTKLLKDEIEVIDTEASSIKSWEEAYNTCFAKMRQNINSNKNRIYVSITLEDIIDIQTDKRKETRPGNKFIKLKLKTNYYVKLKLSVRIKYIEIEEEIL